MSAIKSALQTTLALHRAADSPRATTIRRKARRFIRAYTAARDAGVCLACAQPVAAHFRNGRKLECHQVRTV